MKNYNLEERFIDYALMISTIVENTESNKLGNHIADQLIRSGTSPALNYGEAQGAESRNDFIHKFKIILKELKESRVCLKIIRKKPLVKSVSTVDPVLKETEELISIVYQSIKTARLNNRKKGK